MSFCHEEKKENIQVKEKKETKEEAKKVHGGFEVFEVKGNVYYWPPLGNRWRRVQEGQRIKEGSLLQLEDGAKLKYVFNPHDRVKGWRGEQVIIDVNSPMTLRLEENILRELKTSEKYFTKLLNVEKSNEAFKPLFEDAFDRIMAIFQVNKTNMEQIATLYEKPKDISVGITSRPLNLVFPKDGDSFYQLRYPTDLFMKWIDPNDSAMVYKVYLWRSFDHKGPALALTTQNHYMIQVNEAGSYYVQVTSDDYKYASTPHLVHFTSPISRMKDVVAKKEMNKIFSIFPQDGALILTKVKKVKFSWSLTEDSQFFQTKIFIKSMDEKVKKEPITAVFLPKAECSFETDLENGDYNWWIEGYIETKNVQAVKQITITSKIHAFTYKKSDGDWDKIKNLLSDGRYRNIDFGEGFL